MKLSRIMILLALFSSMIACQTKQEDIVDAIDISIDENVIYQKIHHFGSSAAWWAQAVGQWPDVVVDEIMDLLYDREKGIGLNLIRYNLGGGKANAIVTDPLRRAETLEVSSGVLDLERDAAAIRIIDEAVERGAEVVLFANSPPDRLTVTGAPTGNGRKTNLASGKERDFARYLVDTAEFLKEKKNWPIHDISPINEPQWNWAPKNGQEGCRYSPEEAYLVIRALYEELKERDLVYSISAIDSGEMKLSSNKKYLQLIFDDPELRKAISHYAVHSYWSSAMDRESLYKYMNKNYREIELWMTEWTEMRGGKDLTMDAALVLASTVHEDMVITNASSWQKWIALSPYDYRDGLIYMNSITKSYEISKKLWTLGNWSKFINPGARRIDVSLSQANKLLVSSFRNMDGTVITVLVNRNENLARLVDFSQYGGSADEMGVYETSGLRNLDQVYSGGIGEVTVPPQSIVTVLIQ